MSSFEQVRRRGGPASWLTLGVLSVVGCNSMIGNPQPPPAGSGGDDQGGQAGHGGEEPGDGGGGSGGTAGGSGGIDASGGVDGSGGSGGNPATASTVGVVGEPCAPNGALGCSGYAKKGQLLCADGEWENNGTCSGSNNCDTSESAAGSCQPIHAECEGGEAGDPTTECSGKVPQVCGPDLTGLVDGTTCNSEEGCQGGECLPILPECFSQEEGDSVCSEDGSEVFECGPSLVSRENVEACAAGSACSGAECVQASCAGLADTCGRFEDDDCCTTLLVSGGPFFRGTDASYPANISDFRLDKYEVTVGRFRKFAAAWDADWRPTAGTGRHYHLNDGLGLKTTVGDSTEGGWDATWEVNVDTSDAAREDANGETWTPEPGAKENLPINDVNWFEAYAFAIWDGGFLPSEAEWEYAAAGGAEERTYPWGQPVPTCTLANFYDDGVNDYCVGGPSVVGKLTPQGDGLWQQSDLAGNLWEWTLDWRNSTYSDTCDDCTNATPGTDRIMRGGHWGDPTDYMAAAFRDYYPPSTRFFNLGFRVARSP